MKVKQNFLKFYSTLFHPHLKLNKKQTIGIVGLSLLSFILVFTIIISQQKQELHAYAQTSQQRLSFRHVVIDNTPPRNPHNKAMGDIDKDGFQDLLAASSDGDGIFWYKYPQWTKHKIANGSFTTDMQVGDIDADGNEDVIIPDSSGVHWFKNPGPSQAASAVWQDIVIGTEGADNHDVEIGDINRDGKLDVVTRTKTGNGTFVWLQNSPSSWRRLTVSTREGEGTALGDIDADGDLDIAGNGFWIETPSDVLAGPWNHHNIDSNWPADVGVHIVDINKDGRMDVILAPSESADGRFSWYETTNPKGGQWVEHEIDNTVSYFHTFKSADVDKDGNIDLVTAAMHQSNDPDEVSVYLNDGNGLRWTQYVVATGGSHNLRIGDVGRDGDIDIYGANWDNSAPNGAIIELWENISTFAGSPSQPALSLGPTNVCKDNTGTGGWQRHVIDANKPWISVFITSADIDGDGKKDIITGGWWYKNPGRPDGSWTRQVIGSQLNNMAAVYDFDNDAKPDILGTKGQGSAQDSNFVWARNNGNGTFNILNNISPADGDFLQGVAIAQFSQGKLQVALSWHEGGKGVQMLTVPPSPATDNWTWQRVSTTSQDEDLSKGDIDGDGDVDLLLGTQWLRNDGASWTVFTLNPTAGMPDRNRLVDINKDGKLDAVVGFEAISIAGKLAWYEQPANPTGTWTEHIISNSAVGPMSLDVGDINKDGDSDVVIGEHNLSNPASARTVIFENQDGKGTNWTQHIVYTGDEHHDGTQLVDIDGDADLDIISIGWGHNLVLLYENKSGPQNCATPVVPVYEGH
jgi:FG-GAP-like repeat